MGNSSVLVTLAMIFSVHPHVHGELNALIRILLETIGSSPRAWGTPEICENAGRLERFIPTCMGNSLPSNPSSRGVTVHPHVHGELKYCHDQIDCWFGSSPRAWGTLCHEPPELFQARFIPTCMGNSLPNIYQKGEGYFHPSKYRIRNSS